MTSRIVLIACAGLLAIPPAIHAWGCEGHQIVATIAGRQLTPNARAQVNKLLRNNPIDPQLKRFCKSQGLTRMQDGATWADDVKKSNGTAEEHFIDIPRTDTSGDVAAACPNDKCITKAMSSNLDKLKSSSSSDEEKADALRYLLHYAGDIHQPLHCADNNDRGGNCVLVKAVTPQSKAKQAMHSAWDTAFVRPAAGPKPSRRRIRRSTPVQSRPSRPSSSTRPTATPRRQRSPSSSPGAGRAWRSC